MSTCDLWIDKMTIHIKMALFLLLCFTSDRGWTETEMFSVSLNDCGCHAVKAQERPLVSSRIKHQTRTLTWVVFWARWIGAVCWGRTPNIWSSDCRGWGGSWGALPASHRSLSSRWHRYSSRPGRALFQTWESPTYTHLTSDQTAVSTHKHTRVV